MHAPSQGVGERDHAAIRVWRLSGAMALSDALGVQSDRIQREALELVTVWGR
ncbi:hypothetical protein [Mycobacterium decipiens]|uniref:hypothetical protein n=1 Tax=Mycobacterium decipiens TaxID=1430326 RepID=UPI001F6237FC|nr:hypothetical protein [Mycobacterium decipiens]